MPDCCILAGSDLNRGLYSWRQAVLHLDGVLSDHLVQFPVPTQTVHLSPMSLMNMESRAVDFGGSQFLELLKSYLCPVWNQGWQRTGADFFLPVSFMWCHPVIPNAPSVNFLTPDSLHVFHFQSFAPKPGCCAPMSGFQALEMNKTRTSNCQNRDP